MRGYAAIGLDRPKDKYNLGGALRAMGCYGAHLLLLAGMRMQRQSADTQKAWRHLPVLEVDDLMAAIPFGAVPVCIEITDDAVPLPQFTHPERAFYIFGPEDGSVKVEYQRRCKHRVMVPTAYCMNLAATVNVVLYDRLAKLDRAAMKEAA